MAALKSVYDPVVLAELTGRIAQLRPDAVRQWGKMTPAQAMAHCASGMDQALGREKPPRLFAGRVIGWMIRPLVLRDDRPFHRDSPTMPTLVISDDRDFARERDRLLAGIHAFAAGPAACTTHPHGFFGKLTPEQWAILVYKHLDHHLRQFGA